jgi:hypothetical protein
MGIKANQVWIQKSNPLVEFHILYVDTLICKYRTYIDEKVYGISEELVSRPDIDYTNIPVSFLPADLWFQRECYLREDIQWE